MKEGDWVQTRNGPARIVAFLPADTDWSAFPRRPRRRQTLIVQYPGGRRHAWTIDTVKLLPLQPAE